MLDTYRLYLKQSSDYCEPHFERFIENYKHYFSKLSYEETKYPFSSKVTTGISFDTVETILPRIIGRNPEFITAAVEPEDVSFEEIAKLVIENQYNNPKLAFLGEPIYLKLVKMVKEALITGTAVGRAFWRRESYKRPVYQYYFPKTKKLVKDPKRAKEYSQKTGLTPEYLKDYETSPFLDDFDLKHLPFFFFYPDPFFPETGRMRYKIERDFYTKQELIDEAETYGYEKTVLEDVLSQKASFTPSITKDFFYQYNQIFNNTFDNSAFATDTSDKMPFYIVDKMWMGGRVYVFVNEKYNLTGDKGIPSPYDLFKDPFIFTYNVLTPHSFYGISEIDAIKKMEDATNDFINMRGDNLYNAMSRIWLVNPSVLDKSKIFRPIPNSVWSVKDVDLAVREIRGQEVTASVYKEVDSLMGQIQKITGVTDYAKGAEGIGIAGRTYGGLRLLQEVANLRFFIKTTVFETITLRALGYYILEMSKQFFNKKRIIRIAGENKIKEIYPEDVRSIKGFMDIHVIPASTRAVDEQAEAMKLNTLLPALAKKAPPFHRMTDELYDRFLLKYLPLFGFRDATYWVRAMRGETKKQEGAQQETQNQEIRQPTMSSTGVRNDVSPLSQLITADANQIPLENLVQK